MTHLIYIYLIINSFFLGAYLTDNFNDDENLKKFLFSVVLILFGGIITLLDFISPKILDCLEYITTEIKFQYRMLFTDYDSRKKKLKRTEELAQNSSKQMQIHSRQIQKKYGR